jgi:hypothetical protein
VNSFRNNYRRKKDLIEVSVRLINLLDEHLVRLGPTPSRALSRWVLSRHQPRRVAADDLQREISGTGFEHDVVGGQAMEEEIATDSGW